MYLKNIEIQGFKSFPDKITVHLNKGITAIVGPNGSGKSNICDAIRWVLGEQSSKALRGSKMEDVIFNGTSLRKAVGFCEVSLTLDNSAHFLASPYDEVTITRRYYRSGESEYYINRASVRLKDIHELLMDTGLGRDGYSVIGQGRIAEILSVKSEDRRQVFEEAAGISKFRYRKDESEKKLKMTEENLSRAQDIISELEGRIGPLSVQSKKALRFLDLREKLKSKEINLWLHSLDKIKSDLVIAAEKLSIAQHTLELNRKAADDTDSEVEALYLGIRKKDIEGERIKGEIFEIQNSISEYKNAIALMENTIENNNRTISRLEDESNVSGDAKSEYEKKITDLNDDILNIKTDLQSYENDLAELLSKSDLFKANDDSIQSRLLCLNSEYNKLADYISSLQISLSAANAEQNAITEHAKGNSDELAKRENALLEAQMHIKETEAKEQEISERLGTIKNQLDGYDVLLNTKQDKLNSLLHQTEEKKQSLYKKRTRLAMLQDMERDFEGFNNSVKSVMQAQSRGRLINIHAPVSSLLSTEDTFALAIETALGGAVQYIVVDSENDAKSAMGYLKSGNLGRATFLPITSVKGYDIREKGLSKHTGFLGFASSLVKFNPKYQGIVQNLLGRTAVADTIEHAIAIFKAYNYRFKVVTLDGQVLNAGGSMTGGSAPRSIGVFSRKSELSRLLFEVSSEEKSLEEAVDKLSLLQNEVTIVKGHKDSCLCEEADLKNSLSVLFAQKSNYSSEVSRLTSELSALKEGLLRNKERTCELAELIDKNTSLLHEEKLKLQNSEEKRSMLISESEALKNQTEQLKDSITTLRLSINSCQKDMEAKNLSIIDIRKQIEDIDVSHKNREEEIISLNAQITELLENIKSQKELINLKQESISAKSKLVTELGQQKQNLEGQITIRQKEAKEQRNRLLDLQKEHARLEANLTSLRAEEENLSSKLWEAYELTLSSAEKYRCNIDSLSALNRDISALKNEIKSLGNINLDAIEEYKEVKKRYEFLCAQRDDLLTAKEDLIHLIESMTSQMKQIFSKQFKIINEAFCKTFSELFGGGKAELSLSDPGNVLNSGIEIKVQPPGKNVKNLSLLSGGEQAFTAIALVFAILKVRPTPFCVFDEIEAALDDVNVFRFANYLNNYDNTIQFIVITHRRGTMEAADLLYGVTMQEHGVSKMLAINIADIEKKLKLK